MELLWLTSSSVKADHVIHLAEQKPYTAVVLEVGKEDLEVETEDKAWVLDALLVLRAVPNPLPLWVFDPAATPEAAQSWIEAGADRVALSTAQIRQLTERISLPRTKRSLIGSSASIENVLSNVEMIAGRRCNVLIEGETGTGKEVVAKEIHSSGSRGRGPWVAVNCGAIPEALLEAELFGHVKGAFTGAVQSRAGKFEAASHGTIFLDEIGEMPLSVQAKLLRVLQEREVERLGGNERIRLDVRVIAATNASLANRVREGSFRQDLYYRLNVFRIAMPSLRERPEDIEELARHFVAKFCAADNLRPKALDARALDELMRHDWPGNVRELENLIEAAVILSGSRSTIGFSDIRFGDSAVLAAAAGVSDSSRLNIRTTSVPALAIPVEGLDYQEALHAFEHSLLTQAIARTRGNKTAAADLLRLKRTTLSARMRTLEGRVSRLVA